MAILGLDLAALHARASLQRFEALEGPRNGSINHRDDDDNAGLAGSVIPSTIGRLANPGLRRAHLYQNGFGGTIPPSIGELTSLQKLMLDGARPTVHAANIDYAPPRWP